MDNPTQNRIAKLHPLVREEETILGNPLYLSIVDELKEQEYVVEETWTTTLPTQLIALQKSGVSVDAIGLPTLEDCQNNTSPKLIANDAKLGVSKVINSNTDKI